MTLTFLHVEGMTCDHCARTVQKALQSIPGVQKAEVSLPQQKATVTYEGVFDLAAAQRAVEAEGYRALP